MICVIVPAHNEAELIDACLRSIAIAGAHPDLGGETVEIVVVLDSCSDHTAQVVAKHPAHAISIVGRNVGRARSAGADAALARGARWLAFTDADSTVSPRWLVEQLALAADVVCGTVGVEDWTPHGMQGDFLRQRFDATYFDVDGHSHVHGANLGISAAAYQAAGGFEALPCSEDVALICALQRSGARIVWSAKPRVVTSARAQSRVSGGFATALLAHLQDLPSSVTSAVALR